MLLAQELNAGFIPVRKPNKLPYETISASYDLEYGWIPWKFMSMPFKRRQNPYTR
jgi:adenine/guanine phosphoribosyltransferase-like PRPP-binding protein